MNKKMLFFLLLFFSLQNLYAERIVYFINKSDIPKEEFIYFIFSWHSPNAAQAAEDRKKHKLGFMTRFSPSTKQVTRFPDHIDLDKLIDVHTNQLIPSNYIVDLKIVTQHASGLKTRGPNPQTIFLTGSQENLQPGIYNVVISENGAAIELEKVDTIKSQK